jgi:hypothetical protein
MNLEKEKDLNLISAGGGGQNLPQPAGSWAVQPALLPDKRKEVGPVWWPTWPALRQKDVGQKEVGPV